MSNHIETRAYWLILSFTVILSFAASGQTFTGSFCTSNGSHNVVVTFSSSPCNCFLWDVRGYDSGDNQLWGDQGRQDQITQNRYENRGVGGNTAKIRIHVKYNGQETGFQDVNYEQYMNFGDGCSVCTDGQKRNVQTTPIWHSQAYLEICTNHIEECVNGQWQTTDSDCGCYCDFNGRKFKCGVRWILCYGADHHTPCRWYECVTGVLSPVQDAECECAFEAHEGDGVLTGPNDTPWFHQDDSGALIPGPPAGGIGEGGDGSVSTNGIGGPPTDRTNTNGYAGDVVQIGNLTEVANAVAAGVEQAFEDEGGLHISTEGLMPNGGTLNFGTDPSISVGANTGDDLPSNPLGSSDIEGAYDAWHNVPTLTIASLTLPTIGQESVISLPVTIRGTTTTHSIDLSNYSGAITIFREICLAALGIFGWWAFVWIVRWSIA